MASRRRTSPAEADRGTSSSVERKREERENGNRKKWFATFFPPFSALAHTALSIDLAHFFFSLLSSALFRLNSHLIFSFAFFFLVGFSSLQPTFLARGPRRWLLSLPVRF